MIAALLKLLNLRGFKTEDYNIVVAYGICNFNIGAVERAECYRAVKHKLHIAGAGSFCAGKRNLL